jgi:hypothetical protein
MSYFFFLGAPDIHIATCRRGINRSSVLRPSSLRFPVTIPFENP